jgi:co-chaperonin GroES (HSP10)
LRIHYSGNQQQKVKVMINNPKRHIRKICPLGFRVLVQIEVEADQTDSGLYLPEGSKEAMQESILAEVIEVASATDMSTDEETNVSGIPLGAKVLISKSAGVRVPWDDRMRIVESQDILAIVELVSLV